MTGRLSRRALLRSAAAAATATPARHRLLAQTNARPPLPVAAVVTVYTRNSHADVLVGKILEGFGQQGGPGPALRLVGLYADQSPAGDLSRLLARKHGFRLAQSIDEALTLGTNQLQVQGVLSIGEHGDYPFTPDTGQHMYPRRRFFDEIVQCFRRTGQVAPVFNDKHLSYRWTDAKAMYERVTEMRIPFMAGSSLPVAWRRPPLTLPIGCPVASALAVGYGGRESYGFHALEMLQCLVERREGGEQGVAAVRALRGNEVRNAAERGEWSQELFAAALRTMPDSPSPDLARLNDQAAVYQIQYRDGLRADVVMANGIARHFAFAASLRQQREPVATWFELQDGPPFGHFGYLLRAIEHMVHTRQPAYPAARTLLTTGALDAILHSLANRGKWQDTPELAICYHPVDWPFAT